MSETDNAPCLIGVGEASERIDAPTWAGLSPVELAAAAARSALDDAGGEGLAGQIDVIAAIRQFEVSGPQAKPPFGASDNFARSVGRRIGADPARAVLEVVGGQGPQHLVNEFAHALARGEAKMVLLVGSEAISTVRHLQARGETRDWAESVGGQIEDRGFGNSGLLTRDIPAHGARTAISIYALLENSRRGRLGLDRAAYRLEMGRLFAPFTRVAAESPHAMSRAIYSAEDLAQIGDANRLTSDPFPRRMVARDQANQGAAVLMTTAKAARALGVADDRLVFLHGGADVKERTVIERQDLSRGPASAAACRAAMEAAGAGLEEIDLFDLYSCFPIAVFNICDDLGLATDDPRGLTVTGGLPYFGGAGNNYSMHAIAVMARRLRASPGARGLVGANGGMLSKYSVGIYSTEPRPWTGFDNGPLQARIDGWPAPAVAADYAGPARIETYTIDHASAPPTATIIARTPSDARIVAVATADDGDIVAAMIENEPLGAAISVAAGEDARTHVRTFEPGR